MSILYIWKCNKENCIAYTQVHFWDLSENLPIFARSFNKAINSVKYYMKYKTEAKPNLGFQGPTYQYRSYHFWSLVHPTCCHKFQKWNNSETLTHSKIYLFKQGQKVFWSTSANAKIHRYLDTSHSWFQTETVTHPQTNIAHCCLTLVSRRIVITLCHNFWRSDARRAYVWGKAKRTCVLLAIGKQER